MRKLRTALIVICCLWTVSQAMASTKDSKRLTKIGQSLFELQQDYLALKEDYENRKRQWNDQQDLFDRLVIELSEKNQALTEQAAQLQRQVDRFEESLGDAESVQLARDIKELGYLLKAIILDEVKEQFQSEELLLEIVNDANSRIPRDLVVLYLATRKEKQKEWEDALGYYGTMITEFPDSPYVFRSLLAMSDVFGKLGKTEEQTVLLNQLVYLDEDNPYSVEAKKRLAALEPESLTPEPTIIQDATSDIAEDLEEDIVLDTIAAPIPEQASIIQDETADVPHILPISESAEVAAEVSEVLPESQELKPADTTSDVLPEEVSIDSMAVEKVEPVDSTTDIPPAEEISEVTLESQELKSADTTSDVLPEQASIDSMAVEKVEPVDSTMDIPPAEEISEVTLESQELKSADTTSDVLPEEASIDSMAVEEVESVDSTTDIPPAEEASEVTLESQELKSADTTSDVLPEEVSIDSMVAEEVVPVDSTTDILPMDEPRPSSEYQEDSLVEEKPDILVEEEPEIPILPDKPSPAVVETDEPVDSTADTLPVGEPISSPKYQEDALEEEKTEVLEEREPEVPIASEEPLRVGGTDLVLPVEEAIVSDVTDDTITNDSPDKILITPLDYSETEPVDTTSDISINRETSIDDSADLPSESVLEEPIESSIDIIPEKAETDQTSDSIKSRPSVIELDQLEEPNWNFDL